MLLIQGDNVLLYNLHLRLRALIVLRLTKSCKRRLYYCCRLLTNAFRLSEFWFDLASVCAPTI